MPRIYLNSLNLILVLKFLSLFSIFKLSQNSTQMGNSNEPGSLYWLQALPFDVTKVFVYIHN